MAADVARARKNLKRAESKKSHSWWWDSHITPRNSKWLADNLDEMEKSIKRMLKLVEEDADSFAKKAEMYYRKRPELINLVEEFYRMYRSLAERYDYVTGELKKSIPSDLQSQSSGISDVSTDLPFVLPSSENRLARHKFGPRAAGFQQFLGQREGEESSCLTDSEIDSDDSSVKNYSDFVDCDEQAPLTRKLIDLEMDLREAKSKLQMLHELNARFASCEMENKTPIDPYNRIETYEQELKETKEKLQFSEGQIERLKFELQCEGSQFEEAAEVQPDAKIQTLNEELKATRDRFQDVEKELSLLKEEIEVNRCSNEKLCDLQNQVELALREAATWKDKANLERDEVLKQQERISMLKSSLYDRDREIRDLKEDILVTVDEKKELEEEILEKNDCIERLKAELSDKHEMVHRKERDLQELERERKNLMDNSDELERLADGLRLRVKELEEEVERQSVVINEAAEEKREAIRQLCFSLEHYRSGYVRLRTAINAGRQVKGIPVLVS